MRQQHVSQPPWLQNISKPQLHFMPPEIFEQSLLLITMRAVAGIGPYTGNAIASIAGNERVAVVDANVVRVLARLRRLAGDQKSKPMVQLNAKLADSLVDPNRPGCFNQVSRSPSVLGLQRRLSARAQYCLKGISVLQ